MEQVEKISTIKELSLSINDNSTLFLLNKFSKDFDINKLLLDIYDFESLEQFYTIKYSYSYDNISWSNPLTRDRWNHFNSDDIVTNCLSIYVCVQFSKIETDLENDNKPQTLRVEKTKLNDARLQLNGITYDGIKIDISDEKQISLVTLQKAIEKYPRWNFYEGQNVLVERWLDQLVAVTQMYGHIAVYFKTEATETNHTLSNHVLRNVTQIKKMLFTAPNNELPADRNVYSEWDLNLDGDFTIQIVDSIFKKSFGVNKVPLTKDYIYIPILNKMWRINSVQPKLGVMGKIGMWDVSLVKYEKDETITVSQDLKENYSDFEDFGTGINFFSELEDFNMDTDFTEEKIKKDTVQEKKKATDNYSNRFLDSTSYTDIKETDAQREFYSNRLDIVSISPSESLFPVTMYDASEVDKRVVALTYNMIDLCSVNKFTLINEVVEVSFDFVLTKKFDGELMTLQGNDNNPLMTVKIERKQYVSIVLNQFNYTRKLDYVFDINEFYGVHIKFIESSKQLSVVVYKLVNGIKQIVFQDLVIVTTESPNKMEFGSLYLYGGTYLISNVKCEVNGNEIIHDTATPVLMMQNKYRN